MRSALVLVLGVLVASPSCSSANPASPTGSAIATITLSGSDITYQRVATGAVAGIPLIAGLRARPNQAGTANAAFKAIGNGTFILANPITLNLDTDYWLAVRDPAFPMVCCWESGSKDADVTVLGKRLTRSGSVSTSMDSNMSTAAQFVKISLNLSLFGVNRSVQ